MWQLWPGSNRIFLKQDILHKSKQNAEDFVRPCQAGKVWPMHRVCMSSFAGACQNESGDRYIGHWSKGLRQGKGRCLFANGDKYDGDWLEDKRSGQGICIFANQDRYTGDTATFAT